MLISMLICRAPTDSGVSSARNVRSANRAALSPTAVPLITIANSSPLKRATRPGPSSAVRKWPATAQST